MGGRMLEYEAKTIYREGCREGLQMVPRNEFPDPEEYKKALPGMFILLIREGCTIKEATARTGIPEEDADRALVKMLRQQEE